MAEVRKVAPKDKFRVIAKPFSGADYLVRDWSSFQDAVKDTDAMHAGPSFNEFFFYDDHGKLVYDPAKKG